MNSWAVSFSTERRLVGDNGTEDHMSSDLIRQSSTQTLRSVSCPSRLAVNITCIEGTKAVNIFDMFRLRVEPDTTEVRHDP